MSRVFKMNFSGIYKMYIEKAERKDRTKEEVDEIIYWLTGYDDASFQAQLEKEVSVETFFAEAPQMNEKTALIKGVICGYRVEDIEDP